MRQTPVHERPEASGQGQDESIELRQEQPIQGRGEQSPGIQPEDSRRRSQEVGLALIKLADCMRIERQLGPKYSHLTVLAKQAFEQALSDFVDTLNG